MVNALSQRPFRKVLVANRGEIALRIMRACRHMGVETVAVHSMADADALHVRFADEAVCVGPGPAMESYLNVPAIVAAAEVSGAEAVHPGYGFLSENADFAEVCARCDLTFIGPKPEHIRNWGDKVRARAMAKELGLPVAVGTTNLTRVEDAIDQAEAVGYPVLLKAAHGGGGRGMKVVRSREDMVRLLPQAKKESLAAFGRDEVYFEKYFDQPRHVEFQVLCDGRGGVWILGERECSIQRRHQKIVEEAPCLHLSTEQRTGMYAVIERAMMESAYVSAGTLEFLMDTDGKLYFMEMNTRIQVEHPVTEMVTGVDLVAEQIRIAAGVPVDFPVKQPEFRGHAVECRINAEHPDNFQPSPGRIEEYHPPGGAGIRVDSGVYGGWRVPPHYDSMLLKLISHGRHRPEALARMDRALAETIITGIHTNVALHRRIVASEAFREGRFHTRWLEEDLL